MNKFIILLGVKVTLFCFIHLHLNYIFIFELYHSSFGERLKFAVVRDFITLFDNLLNFHAIIVSVEPAGIGKESKIGWNTAKLCHPSLIK